MKTMRIDKFLSEMQIASRTESKKMIKAGRIRINDQTALDAAQKISPDTDVLFVDDRPVSYQEYQYFMLNKPAGCITATEDGRQSTVMEYLPRERHKNLSPVGRLDKDTEGLLLITDDGTLNHNLLSPARHVEKTYYARIQGCVTQKEQEVFAAGLEIGEKKKTAPAKLNILSADAESEVTVTITEGKFHQIKRMFQAVNMEVLYLKRLSMGTLFLDPDLKSGECRELTAEEIKLLKECTNVRK